MAARLSGCEFIAEYLIKEGVPFVAGLPGHAMMAWEDAFKDRQDRIGMVQVKHEQAALHLADGYFRACHKPIVCYTSAGPGAINTLIGLATAYVDSMPIVYFSANVPTQFFDKDALQSLDMQHVSDINQMIRPCVKRSWQVTHIYQLPDILQNAFRIALSGRPGPVHIDLPQDVQADSLDAAIPDPENHKVSSRMLGDIEYIRRGVELLSKAKRPAILAGGGVLLSEAWEELQAIAEHIGAPVVATVQGKGVIAEDHPLCLFYGGSKGATCGNNVMKNADVILAVGCRFAEWTSSSYTRGETFNIPPTKMIHIDIDPREIGKNYPVEVPILGDAKTCLKEILIQLRAKGPALAYQETPYFRELQGWKKEWLDRLATQIRDCRPMTMSCALKELREFLPRDAIVVGAAGHPQHQLFNEFPVYGPLTHISTGGYSTLGWCTPASMGIKLARPDKMVVAVEGDGDFMMTMQELATAVMYNIPIVIVVMNNFGWISIRDLQHSEYGPDRYFGNEFFSKKTGRRYNPHFAEAAKTFEAHGELVTEPENIKPALKRAFDSGIPALLEIHTAYDFPESAGIVSGFQLFPVPEKYRKPGSPNA
ncbi:MAG: thiamine pyrophosphate-binding protein [Armatimonadetes bacterium]|nr:thiamine pyrophosphate-binding protein [Armatimonadota bacterium]